MTRYEILVYVATGSWLLWAICFVAYLIGSLVSDSVHERRRKRSKVVVNPGCDLDRIGRNEQRRKE